MNAAKFVPISAAAYVILYWLSMYYANNFKSNSDAAGAGLEHGYTVLLVIAIFFFIALVLTGINIYLFKRIPETWIKLVAFVPITISIFHGVKIYTS